MKRFEAWLSEHRRLEAVVVVVAGLGVWVAAMILLIIIFG